MSRSAALTTALAIAFSLAARWPIASHDLEHYIGPDEGEVVENVLEMVKTGDFDPRHPGYPGLHFYLQRIPVEMRLWLEGKSVADVSREDFYLGARRMTLLAGAATSAVVFVAGLRFLTPWGGALAASLCAASPLAFRESAVVNPDLMLGLFVAVSLLLSLRLVEVLSSVRSIPAGAAAGLAAAVKYTGGIAVAPFLAACLFAPGNRRARAISVLAGIAAVVLAFGLASPYTWLALERSLGGLSMHVGYYAASANNAALEVLKVLGTRGLGVPAAFAAALGAALALHSREPRRLVVLAFPAAYLLVLSFFDRAYPRHALVLLPGASLLAADAAERLRGKLRWVLAAAMIGVPLLGSLDLWMRSRAESPADLAAAWVAAELPADSRILQDQWTPRLDSDRFRVHRVGVEEAVFPGNFEWVLYSGYPPGIDTTGLREVRRFTNENALGTEVVAYQVPERASLMGVTLGEADARAAIGAGELRYFGEGFDEARPGAFGTSRLSRGEASEIFFVLPESGDRKRLLFELELAAAVEGKPIEVELELNGERAGSFEVRSSEPSTASVLSELSRAGLNRIVLRYDRTVRLDRRHREAAVRFYRLSITRY